MRHIFHIHSPISYFCALQVIQEENLCPNSVVILWKNYRPKSHFGILIMPSFAQHKKTNILLKYDLLKSHDNYVDQITNGEEFIAYIDLAHYFQKLLITHAGCMSFNFLEEGTASYLVPHNLNYLTFIENRSSFRNAKLSEYIRSLLMVIRGFNLKLLSIPYFPYAFSGIDSVKYYCFDRNAYPGVPLDRKIILDGPSRVHSKDVSLMDKLVFIEESFFHVMKICSSDTERSHKLSISFVVNHFKNRDIWIKLRPGQKIDESLWCRFLSDLGLRYKIFETDLILEELMSVTKDGVFIGTVSSLLYYASLFGHQSYSNYTTVNASENEHDFMEFYWNLVDTDSIKSMI